MEKVKVSLKLDSNVVDQANAVASENNITLDAFIETILMQALTGGVDVESTGDTERESE